MSRAARRRKARAEYALGVTPLPSELPLFPLESVVLYPKLRTPLHIFEPRYRQMMESALRGDRALGMATVLPEHRDEMAGAPPLFAIGCAGFIEAFERLPDGRFNLLLNGTARFRMLRELPPETGRLYRVAEVEWLAEAELSPAEDAALRAARVRVMDVLHEVIARARSSEPLARDALDALDATTFTNSLCQMLQLPAEEKQSLLEADGTARRLDALEGLLQIHLARLKLPFNPTDTLH
jgi:uncharacterized protein